MSFSSSKQKLKIFLSYTSSDYKRVILRFKRLLVHNFDPWLDRENLQPGQEWKIEIQKAIDTSDVILIFLSKNSITKSGFVQKEIRWALDKSEEKPSGTVFIIPARLEDCEIPFQLQSYQWIDLYTRNGFRKLVNVLNDIAENKGKLTEERTEKDLLIQEPYKELKVSLAQLPPNELSVVYSMLMPGQAIPQWSKKLLNGIYVSLDTQRDAIATIKSVAYAFDMFDVLNSLSLIAVQNQRR